MKRLIRRHRSFLLCLFFVCLLPILFLALIKKPPVSAYGADEFVTTWTTNVAGASEPTKVTLNFQVLSGTPYYLVDWTCDGNVDDIIYDAHYTHDFVHAGTYNICIKTLSPLAFYAPGLADDEKAKLQEIKQWGSIKWSSFREAFKGMGNMKLTASDAPNLSGVTDMYAAFEGATSFTGNDSMSSWDTTNVVNMGSLFKNATNFNAPIGSWITTNVTDMSSMFKNASSFNQPLSSWQTGKVTNMSSMFFGANAFNQGIGNWNTGEVVDMTMMFDGANSFNNGALSGEVGNALAWNTSKVRYLERMFAGASSFNSPVNGWDISGVTNLTRVFMGASSFNQPLNSWSLNNVTTTKEMFKDATAFNQNIGGWKTLALTDMSNMFWSASAFNNGQLAGESGASLKWNTSQVKDMGGVFYYATSFNQPLNEWNTAEVVNMGSMFGGATMFNQDISGWNTGKVNNMSTMFRNAVSFNQNIGGWSTGEVTDMSNMFNNAITFNQPIGGWSTDNVINMHGMFAYNPVFNQNLSGWNTEKVEDMGSMFSNAAVFNQDISGWDTSSVTNMSSMFESAGMFNQNIGGWNTGEVTNMSNMFNNASIFNQDISNWNVSKVTDFTSFMNYSNMKSSNYDKLLNNWNEQNVNFDITFGALGVYYCNAHIARNNLMSPPRNWNILDAGQNCPPSAMTITNTLVPENTTPVGTISATDPEGGNIKYTLVNGVGGEDNSKFMLNINTGVLAFIDPPDFESKADLGDTPGNNTYSILVKATDEVGNYVEQVFIITVLDVDDVAPIIDIIPGIKHSTSPITDTVVKVSDRFSIASLEPTVLSTSYVDDISCTPDNPDSTEDIDFPFSNLNPTEGNHLHLTCTIRINNTGNVVLKATDNEGYSSIATAQGYIVDTMGPIFSVARVDTKTDGNTVDDPTVYYEVFDTYNLDRFEVEYKKDNNAEGVDDFVTTYVDDVITGSVKLDLDPHEKPHTIRIIAYDKAGNHTTREIKFPPEIAFISPTTISNTVINNSQVVITATDSSGTISNISLSGTASDGVSLANCTNTTSPDLMPQVICDIQGINSTGLITVSATDDYSGLSGSNSQQYFHDDTYPVLAVDAPTKLSNAPITDTTIVLTDNVAVDKVEVDTASTTVAYSDFNCTQIHSKELHCTININSSGKLILKGYDVATNSVTHTESDYIVDTILPNLTIENTDVITSANKANFRVHGNCTYGDSDVFLKVGPDEQGFQVTCANNDTWEIYIDFSSYLDGNISVRAKQSDNAGNNKVETKNILKDTIGPIITLPNLNAINSVNVHSYRLFGVCSSVGGTFTLNVAGVDSIVVPCSFDQWEHYYDFSAIPDGNVKVSITQDDEYGNNTYKERILVKRTDRLDVVISTTENAVVDKEKIKFTVQLSEDSDCLTKELFTITGSSSALIESLTEIDPRNYEVYLNNLSNNDDIQLRLDANTFRDIYGNYNNEATLNYISVFIDKEPPQISLNGASPIDVLMDSVYIDLGVTCTDNYSGGCLVTVVNQLNIHQVGTYRIIYTGRDTLGREATIERLINVIAPAPPVIDGGSDNDKTPQLPKTKPPIVSSGSRLLDNIYQDEQLSIIDEEKEEEEEEKIETVRNEVNVYKEHPTEYHSSFAKSVLKVTGGTCNDIEKVEVMDVKDIKNPRLVNIVSGLKFNLTCKQKGGDANVTIILGEKYEDISKLVLYKEEDGKLVDITDRIKFGEENGKTTITYKLTDGISLDEDQKANAEIIDPIYLGIRQTVEWWYCLLPVLLILIIAIISKKKKRQ